ncbi:hypothetical protein RI129_002464 [Pyrocoelia pectoralis]|uniref:Uncharacterized protein n=1 Tax=Pyrocoelia pectoralis TaxID=417401 RepID=A0AAN7ZM77_9COLE
MVGDANTKIGKEEEYQPTIEMFSKHEITNNNEKRITDFAVEREMVIKSTCFQLKDQET